ncbi:MAG: hypothetical protein MI674_07100 [Cytophagales bacterium]|nr:hypothetical protein [Cytophagales bacterium]
MKKNTYKSQKRANLFTYIAQFLQRKGFFSEDFPMKYLPYVLYIFFLGILYVGNTHYYEKVIRKITQLEEEVEDLRVDFTTLKADYMFASKQSEVAKRVASREIYESTQPPHKIKLHQRDD